MTENKKIKLKRLIFPVGIFLLMFISEAAIGTAGVVSYFYFSGKKNIAAIESYTTNYSKTMAEAFTRVAEFSFSEKKYASLKTLFHEKIEENTIDEAFFVLTDGKIIVHSSTTAEKELLWNIASDEIAYNLDMILLPVQTKTSDLILNNYNIINKSVPFKRQERDLLKKYVYKDLNSTGWLYTKGVFYKGKPIGTVNFIISKDRIYSSIQESVNQAKQYSLLVLTVSMILSFLISLVILFRYRSIQKNALVSKTAEGFSEQFIPAAPVIVNNTDISQAPDDVIFFTPDSNLVNPVMDYVVEDDVDVNIIDENGLSISSDEMKNKKKPEVPAIKKYEDKPDEEEYITVELLGEIEPEQDIEIQEKPAGIIKEFIAPVISLDDYKNSLNKEIRDAIPVRKKR